MTKNRERHTAALLQGKDEPSHVVEDQDKSPLLQFMRDIGLLSRNGHYIDDGFVLPRVRVALEEKALPTGVLPFETFVGEFTAPGKVVRSARGSSSIPDEKDTSLPSNAFSEYSLFVGMHSDQATESIVDFALSVGKPFAVVPCCVFPKLFADRRLVSTNCCPCALTLTCKVCVSAPSAPQSTSPESGVTVSGEIKSDITEVVSYEEFIHYLMQKSPKILSSSLPFKGRHIVLYTMPEE